MRPRFNVRLVSFEDVHAMPEAWSISDYRDILEALDFDDARGVPDDDARELCLMALTDMEPETAAQVVLQHRLGARLRKGQIEDIAQEMVDEPIWEDYPEMRVHEELYNVNQLLYDAFNGKFPRPRAVRLEIEVKALDAEGASILKQPTDAFMVRLLGGGLQDDSLLHRLFEDQLAGKSFPEAESIVWRCEHSPLREREAHFVIYGSAYWMNQLRDNRVYETVGFPDADEKSKYD